MRISGFIAVAVLAISAAAPAFAADRVSDGELVRASRCLGLAKAANLGPSDPTALQAFVKVQGKSRDMLVQDRADAAERAARTEAGRAKGAQKEALIAERDGACKAMVTTASVATPAGA
jgi:hypothetical protein